MLDSDEIYNLYVQRRRDMEPIHATAATLQQVYDGKFEVVLPELDEREYSGVANLIQTGVDQHAMRIASVIPNIICPPVRPSLTAAKRANQRKLAIQAWWHLNRMQQKLAYRARHLIGMAMSPVLVRPGRDGYPVWEVRKPLETYPAPSAPDDLIPTDTIFCFERSAAWLHEHYPQWSMSLGLNRHKDEMIKLLQYFSAEQYAVIAIGKEMGENQAATMTLTSVPNRAGVPCVVVPGRVTLGALQGQFDQLIGMYATQAKLWALQIHAVMREIFGETWAVANTPGGTPQIVVDADAYDGTVGIIRDGQIQQFRAASAVGPLQAIDRQERSQRLTGAIPAEMGGESVTNIRTGRRGSQVFSATVDFYIQEHQNILAASLEAENKIAIAIAKSYYDDVPRTFYVPLAKGQVSYTPSVTFETDANTVTYAYAGTDTNSLVIEAGQRVAMGTLSKTSFMEIDPIVKDVDTEHDRIIKETLENAVLQSVLQQASIPNGPWQPTDLGRLMELVYTQDVELWQAINQVQMEAQERQAAQAAGELSPEAMQPGINMTGAPGTPQAAIQQPNQDQMNLGLLLANLKQTARPV